MGQPLVFLDTCVLKAAHRVMALGHREVVRTLPGLPDGWQVPIVRWDHNDGILDERQRQECKLVEEIAKAALGGQIELAVGDEVLTEYIQLRKTFPSCGGLMFGATIRRVEAPVPFGASLGSMKDHIAAQLPKVRNKRFVAIRKQVGAWQGKNPAPANQLLDALHLWTAEVNGGQYFLTVDRKLLRYQFPSGTLRIVLPSQLLETTQVGGGRFARLDG